MMNWLYTWYKPRVDPDAEVIAGEMSDIFLRGVRGEKTATGSRDGPRASTVRLRRTAAKAKSAKRKLAPPLAVGRTRS